MTILHFLKSKVKFLSDPIIYVIKLMRGVSTVDNDSKGLELDDPIVKEMLELYVQLKDPQEKQAMLKAIDIFLLGELEEKKLTPEEREQLHQTIAAALGKSRPRRLWRDWIVYGFILLAIIAILLLYFNGGLR